MTEIKGSPRAGLTGATLGFFFGFAAVALFGPTAGLFKEVMGLSPGKVGLLVAVPALTGSLLRIPFAAWVDTTGGRKPFLVLLFLSLAGMGGLTWVANALYPAGLSAELYPLLLVLGALSGCGIATFSVGIGQVSYWHTQEEQGRALGLYAGAGNLAPGIFSFLLPVVLGGLGLGGAYLVWFLLLAFGIVLYALFSRNAWYFQLLNQGMAPDRARSEAAARGQRLFPTGSLKESLMASARARATWLLVAVYFTTFGGFIALTAWFPVYWTSFHGTEGVTAGLLTALYSILASLVRILGGALADRAGGEKTLIGAMAVMLAGAVLMTLSHSFALSVAGVLLLALGMGVGNGAVFKLVPQYVPHAVGGAAGWVGGLGAFGGFVVPPVLGGVVTFLGTGGYALGFGVFILLAGASLALGCHLHRRERMGTS